MKFGGMRMDKSIKISMLLDVYGKLLTERQFDIVDLYYNQNLSLSEIADELRVTRQAIRKSLVEAEKNLFVFEEKLGFLSKKARRDELLDEVLVFDIGSEAKNIIEKVKLI